MTTTMSPPAPTTAPSGGSLRFLSIRADLLPDEIVTARQVEVVRKQVLLGLASLVVLIVAWYAVSWLQTGASNRDLEAAHHQGIAYQNQQQQYGPLVRAQADVQTIQTQLQTLMVGDMSWKTMLNTLRAQAPARVTVTSVSATVAAGGAGAAVPTLNPSGKAAVGQVTLSGSAPDKKTVAAYADRLATAKGLAAPLVSSVTSGAGGVTFTMTVIVTADALGGRYATPAKTATGGN
jgi:Tfp pilus assembly protein PilN